MMLRHAVTAILLAGATLSIPSRSQAQSGLGYGQSAKALTPGKTVTSKFERPVFGDQRHVYLYDGDVRAGKTITVTARWVKKAHEGATLNLVISDPGTELPAGQTANLISADHNSVTATASFATSGLVQIHVLTNAPGFTSTYEITVTEGSATRVLFAEERSQTSGFHFAGGWNTTTFKSQFSTETGQGQGGRVGLGFGPLLLYGELQQSEMENESGDPADAYTLTQREVGARLYLLGKGSRIRPFGQYAYGFRRLESMETSVEGEGISMTPGAGVALYLLKRLSIEGAWTQATGEIDRVRASSDDEWSDVPEEFIIRGPSTRISVQMVLHL